MARRKLAVRVVIASDGKRGHENQSRVVARMLGDTAPLVMLLRDSVKEGGGVELLLRLRFALFGRNTISTKQAAELVRALLKPEQPEEFRAFVRDYAQGMAGRDARPTGKPRLFVVSTGTPPATMNLLLARLLGAQAIVNMTPSLLPRRRFDLNIVPDHDLPFGRVRPPNIIATPLALGCHDAAGGQLMAQQLRREHGLAVEGRYIALAIGGPSKSAPWDTELVHAALDTLHSACAATGKRLLATTSRRTPAETLAHLRGWQAGETLAFLLDAAQDPRNPLPAFYEMAQAVTVTADSFSMASEALHSGHGPLLLPVNVTPPLGRLRRGLELLADRGLASIARDAADIATFIHNPPERGEANAIYEELARSVRRRLGL